MADVGRITELWREAADVLAQAEREQALEVVQTVAAIAQLRKERDDLQAECGRLREQLDAAREALLQIANNAASWHGPDIGHVRALVVCEKVARDALGVVGEQEPDEDNLPSMLP